ncbi:hypothetical protein K7X08_021214 [Anisodus acutangulus]|uniref:AP2/ERF domain-containing protein n=1 Tax=Anisodus acutangulus TaxID=402998 RepID=A0A9Q1M061_9SOLA|nr:hypothetical protein K7X08_021214 [Anisodus acutangulus]
MDIFQSYFLNPLTEADNSSSFPNNSGTEYSSVMLALNNPKKRAGRKKFHETRHPIYRGVRKRNSDKWVCEVRQPNKKSTLWLGTFPTVEMAARAHDVAAIALRGRSACLNFADSTWRLPIPASSNSNDIQKAAAEAAESFRLPLKLKKASREYIYTPEMPQSVFFVDEEALFYMPGLLANLAQGLMLPPPQCLEIGDHVELVDVVMSLWSYSI